MTTATELKKKADELRKTLAKIDKATGKSNIREREADVKRRKRDSERLVIVPDCKDRELRQSLELDDAKWLSHYFPELFWYEWQPQQLEMIDAIRHAIETGEDQAIAASRGEGKTKIAERLLLKHSLQGTVKLSVLFSVSGGHARDSLRSIMREIEENELLMASYPEVCFPVRELENTPNRAHYQRVSGNRFDTGEPYESAETKFSWCGDEITFPFVPGSPGAGAIIATRGLDAAVRGLNKLNRRVDVAVIDDPDTEDSARSEEQASKLEKRIDSAIGGLGGQRRGVGRVIITTLQSRVAVSYKFTDVTQKPAMKGKRFRFLIHPPERQDLWDEYVQLRKSDWMHESTGEKSTDAMQFYVANRAEMDQGAVTANAFRFYPQLQISPLQFYFDELAKKGAAYVATELDNDPPAEMGPQESGIDKARIQRQLSGFPQGEVPPDCTLLTQGVDVGKYWLYWTVRAWKADGTGYTIDYGRQAVLGTTCGEEDGLDRAIHREIIQRMNDFRDQPYSQQFRESLTLVDSGYRTDAVYKACSQIGQGIMPVKGFGTSAGCVQVSWHEAQRKTFDKQPICDGVFRSRQGEGSAKVWVVCCHADKWKSWEHDRWMTATDKPGCLFLWGEKSTGQRMTSDELGHSHYAHSVTAEVEIEDIVKGALVRRWKSKSKENHWLDSSYYTDVAAAIKGLRIIGSVKKPLSPSERPSARDLANRIRGIA